MTRLASGVRLPPSLYRYFWEYDAARLEPDAAQATIMLRLMESGDQDAIRWLRTFYGDPVLGDFVRRRRGRGMSLKRLRYWGLVLQIPRAAVDGWQASLRLNPWYRRTHR